MAGFNPFPFIAGFLGGGPVGGALALGAALTRSGHPQAKEVGETLQTLFGKGEGSLTASQRAVIAKQASVERIALSQDETARIISDDKLVLGSLEAAVASGSRALIFAAAYKACARPSAIYGTIALALFYAFDKGITPEKGEQIEGMMWILGGLAGIHFFQRSRERMNGKS